MPIYLASKSSHKSLHSLPAEKALFIVTVSEFLISDSIKGMDPKVSIFLFLGLFGWKSITYDW